MFESAVTPVLADIAANDTSGWVSGSVLLAIVSAIFGGGGLVYGGYKGRQAKEEAERRTVEGTVKAQIPQPLTQEQSASQANWKENAKDHENIFGRITALEKGHAELKGTVEAKFSYMEKQLDRLTDMVQQLFDKIITGNRRKA